MWTLLMIAVGVTIGWQFPQPQIAKTAQDAIVAWIKSLWTKYVGGPR